MSAARDSIKQQVVEAIVGMNMPEYAERYLRIRTKADAIQPFRLNVPQLYVHRRAEIQMERRGYVRVSLLKARQWGGSSYVQARFYSRIARGGVGLRAFILTHQAAATRNIFAMTRRFYLRQDARIRPKADLALNHMNFPRLDSSYAVATAGSEAVGVGDTIQLFHASEVGLWPSADDHMRDSLQAVPSGAETKRGTEVWLESTGRGIGNAFHKNFTYARAGLSDFEALFVPWFWIDEYRAPVVADLDLSAEDEEYAEFWGLDEEQMQFRYNKIIEMGGGEAGRIRWNTQYPATPEDGFSAEIAGGYIEARYVLRARRTLPWTIVPRGPRIMGIDPSYLGDDRFITFMRQGRLAWRIGRWQKLNTTASIGRLRLLIEQHKPDIICVDLGGTPGGAIYDGLVSLIRASKLPIVMVPVMGGESADDPERWRNKTSENWGRMREWFEDVLPPCIIDAVPGDPEEPDSGLEEIQGDITNPLTDWDNKGRPVRETKKRLLSHAPSPNNGDALANTFTLAVGDDWTPPKVPEEHEREDRPKLNWKAI